MCNREIELRHKLLPGFPIDECAANQAVSARIELS
jgi:hypothetical protein